VARLLTAVEWLGNLLPHPVTLFALFAFAIFLISGIASAFSLSVGDPRPGNEGEIFVVRSLVNGEGFRWIAPVWRSARDCSPRPSAGWFWARRRTW
jgi:aminobenzoyl-glutamate transport protein